MAGHAASADLDRGTAFRLIQALIELGYLQALPKLIRLTTTVQEITIKSGLLS
ncbi:helix-turn-helix domain-containing protein [Bradyrhizobium sp. LB11.1]|jgi:IclR family pca regulon transcriptional regulator|uniref:helix-turn-helix domain-containing protein n=1 Tax=Bradyrhizobium sp. LB11.1 TaxID=3156326 RepID=UPI00339151EB